MKVSFPLSLRHHHLLKDSTHSEVCLNILPPFEIWPLHAVRCRSPTASFSPCILTYWWDSGASLHLNTGWDKGSTKHSDFRRCQDIRRGTNANTCEAVIIPVAVGANELHQRWFPASGMKVVCCAESSNQLFLLRLWVLAALVNTHLQQVVYCESTAGRWMWVGWTIAPCFNTADTPASREGSHGWLLWRGDALKDRKCPLLSSRFGSADSAEQSPVLWSTNWFCSSWAWCLDPIHHRGNTTLLRFLPLYRVKRVFSPLCEGDALNKKKVLWMCEQCSSGPEWTAASQNAKYYSHKILSILLLSLALCFLPDKPSALFPDDYHLPSRGDGHSH